MVLSVPIYIQAPPAEDGTCNRHLLVTVHLIQVGPDNVRVETSWNALEWSASAPTTNVEVSVPRRRGVQVYLPRNPFNMPMYVVITRRNRYGTSYRVGTAIHLRDSPSGTIGLDVSFLHIRRRNALHSSHVCIVRGGTPIPAEDVVGDEANDAESGDVAQTGELDE
ncbi:hypothetical protein C2E23DRAFT_725057 [Lenzites betulinus]|nr:hypothetical protein C2E23DRAFT_725057 [Lenzites betulinus]